VKPPPTTGGVRSRPVHGREYSSYRGCTRPILGILSAELATAKQPLATRGTLNFPREERNVDRASPDAQPSEPMDAAETYQHIFFYFIQALGILAMDPELQCEAEGNVNVAQELKNEILSGRYVIGKGKLSESEETAIAILAAAVAAVPDSALTFANGHAPNVKNMTHPAWTPIRAQATSLLGILDSRIAVNKAYFD
jgi:hypothetical protein